MSNFDEIKSLNLFGGNEGENKNEEAIGGEMIGTVDAKGKPLDSILEMLSQMRDPSTDDADDDFDNDDNVMDADDYHNKACDMPWDRPSQNLCKPPMWCRIEAPHWRFLLCPERIVPPKKTRVGKKSENCCRWRT